MDGQQPLLFFISSLSNSVSISVSPSASISISNSISISISYSFFFSLLFLLTCCYLCAIFLLSFSPCLQVACKLLPLYLVKVRLLPCGFEPLSRDKVRRGKLHRFRSGFARSVLTAFALPSVRRRKHPGLPSQTAPFVGANSEGPPPAPGAPPSNPAPFSVIVYHVLPC